MTDKAVKLCRDCRHVRDFGDDGEYAKCAAPQNLKPDYVRGGMTFAGWQYCSSQRDSRGGCKPAGKWFEPKAKQEVAA